MRINMIALWFMCFFFNDTATTEIYTLSLHDALPILHRRARRRPRLERAERRAVPVVVGPGGRDGPGAVRAPAVGDDELDRKSTRLNSSHANISYAVFCLT